MYKIINNKMGVPSSIQRLSDGAFIPMNTDNTDYQQYLRWLEEGNVPIPAEENQ